MTVVSARDARLIAEICDALQSAARADETAPLAAGASAAPLPLDARLAQIQTSLERMEARLAELESELAILSGRVASPRRPW
jgi:hypothetical protein